MNKVNNKQASLTDFKILRFLEWHGPHKVKPHFSPTR